MGQANSGLGLFGRQQSGSLFGEGGLFGGGGFAGGGGFGQNFANNFLSSPLLLGGLGTLMGGLRFGLPAFLAGRDIQATQAENVRSQETQEFLQDLLQFQREESTALANRVPNFFDPSTGQIFGPDAGFARPGLRGEGITQAGKPGEGDISDNLITLPEFNVGQTALESFQANLPGLDERTIGFDPIGTIQPNQLFGQLEGLGVLPETDLSEVLGARLGGIQAAGVGREQQRLQEVSALAPQFGGLENLRGVLGGVSAGEGAFRGLESQQAVGQTRGEELAAQQFVSNLAGGLGLEEARLNTAIQQFNQSQGINVQGANINRELGIAQLLSGLEANAANDPLQRTAFIIDAINNSLGLQSGMFQNVTTNTLNELIGQIPLLQQNVALGTSFLPSVTPGRFAGVNTGGGGGSQFNLDLATAIPAAAAGIGALSGAGAAGAGGFGGGLGFLGFI